MAAKTIIQRNIRSTSRFKSSLDNFSFVTVVHVQVTRRHKELVVSSLLNYLFKHVRPTVVSVWLPFSLHVCLTLVLVGSAVEALLRGAFSVLSKETGLDEVRHMYRTIEGRNQCSICFRPIHLCLNSCHPFELLRTFALFSLSLAGAVNAVAPEYGNGFVNVRKGFKVGTSGPTLNCFGLWSKLGGQRNHINTMASVVCT